MSYNEALQNLQRNSPRLFALFNQGRRALGRPDIAPDVQKSVAYALQIHVSHMQQFSQQGVTLAGKRIVEIGPGFDFGAQLLLVDQGGRVTVIDRFLAPWDEAFHPAFYRALRDRCGPSAALDRVIAQGGYQDVIETVSLPLEHIDRLLPKQFDLILSNAVLEHVVDLDRSLAALVKVSAAGALHSHQIDLRAHYDFSRPLEHLLEAGRWTPRLARHFGHPRRAKEIEAAFLQAGLTVRRKIVSEYASPDYLAEFIPRLRASDSSYRDYPVSDIAELSVRYELEKAS